MDVTTILGIVTGFVCVVISILMTGKISDFIDPGSIFIVVGGVVAATLASYPPTRLKATLAALKQVTKKNSNNLDEEIETIIKIANVARKDGLLALEEMTDGIKDDFLKKGIMLVVDGSEPELIQNILETELEATKERHADNRAVLESMAGFSPSFGMIGTLIGLINMLKNMDSMDALGAGMATALVTTFYGSMMASLIFTPLSNKLKAAGQVEYLRKELIVEGILSVQNGENPRIIKEKLNSFLSLAQMNGKGNSTKDEKEKE